MTSSPNTSPAGHPQLRCGARVLDLRVPVVMGILNTTPDSFSDGGQLTDVDAAIDRAAQMVADGAGILDVGGESTRPGAAHVDEAEELERVVPVVDALSARFDAVVSVDTSKPRVMAEAVGAGASLINDVRALTVPGALAVAAGCDAGVCLMHMRGQPQTMQRAPRYGDVVAEVSAYLRGRVAACNRAGIARDRLCVDPGFGFAKTLEHNLQIVANLTELCSSGLPLLFGASRKRSIGELTGAPVEERVHGSVAMALLAVERGARILRVHDVRETVHAVRVAEAVRQVGLST